jgi:hypothetical protein
MRQADVQAAIEADDLWSLDHVVGAAKEALRVPPDGAAVAGTAAPGARKLAMTARIESDRRLMTGSCNRRRLADFGSTSKHPPLDAAGNQVGKSQGGFCPREVSV